MMRKFFAFICAAILPFILGGQTQLFSGASVLSGSLLPAANDASANWKNAGLQSIGGIPTRNTQCGSTVSPSGLTPPTTGDDADLINAAITACPAGEVVALASGTFNISMSEFVALNKAITLRGNGLCAGTLTVASGAYLPLCNTVLVQSDGLVHNNGPETCSGGSCSGNPVIYMAPSAITASGIFGAAYSGCSRSTWYVDGTCTGTYVPLAADAAQGAMTVQVTTTSPFSVGQWVMITEASGAKWQTDPVSARGGQVWAAADLTSSFSSPATGKVEWQNFNPQQGYADFGSGDYPFQANTLGCGGWSLCDRPIGEIHVVSAIGAGPCPGTNCTVTFDDPLTVAFRQSGGTQFTGYISGTTLTVTSVQSGTVLIDEPITDQVAVIGGSGATVEGGTYITALGTGSGGPGTYAISTSQTLCSSGSPCAMAAGGYAAKILFATTSNSGTTVSFLENAGIENLSVQRGNGGDVVIQFCAYCWVKNVDASEMAAGAIEVRSAVRVQIDTTAGHDCWNNTNNGNEYPFDFEWWSTEIYEVNSMTWGCGKSRTARSGGAGSVVAYGYYDDLYYGQSSGLDFWLIDASLNGSHFVGGHHILFEGNWAVNFLSDHQHGNNTYQTWFRNYANGYRSTFTDPQSGTTVDDYTNSLGNNGDFEGAKPTAYDYWHAYIGNVMCNPTYCITSNGWVYQSPQGTGEIDKDIFDLGSDDPTGSYDQYLSGATASYYFRTGNYDTVNGSVSWATSNHTLSNSLYLSAAPAFFSAGASCTYTWPWVTPTGSSQLQTPVGGGSCGSYSGLPAKARHDAGTPFVQP